MVVPPAVGPDRRCVGFGGRGGLPAMISAIWSESIVSSSSSALAIASTLSRLSSSSFRATAYCWSMILRISWSTFCIVASDTFFCVVIDRPRKTSPSFSPYTIGPSSSAHAVARDHVARDLVARSKSFDAPVVIWFMNSSSAMRPPNSTEIMFSMWLRSML